MQQTTVIQPRLITLILLNGLAVSSLNLFLPSLPGISAEFEASYALVNLSIAGYATMTAILQPVLGPLSDRFGRRPVILSELLVFSPRLTRLSARDRHRLLSVLPDDAGRHHIRP